jgi:hypothetical protein
MPRPNRASSPARRPCSSLSYLVNASTKPGPPPTSITCEQRQSPRYHGTFTSHLHIRRRSIRPGRPGSPRQLTIAFAHEEARRPLDLDEGGISVGPALDISTDRIKAVRCRWRATLWVQARGAIVSATRSGIPICRRRLRRTPRRMGCRDAQIGASAGSSSVRQPTQSICGRLPRGVWTTELGDPSRLASALARALSVDAFASGDLNLAPRPECCRSGVDRGMRLVFRGRGVHSGVAATGGVPRVDR